MIVYTDGGCRGNGNSGQGGIGVVIYAEHGNKIIEIAEFIGEVTNNVAEYKALIRACEFLHGAFKPAELSVTFHTDSKLMAEQVAGRWKVKDSRIKELHADVRRLLEGFRAWGLIWIPREDNTEADALANLAMDRELALLLEK